MANEIKYTSFDLMKIFGIKKGSWYNVKINLNQINIQNKYQMESK